MQQYDYIIVGAGLSGLMLAHQFAQDSFFAQKKILILDKEQQQTHEKTWSFWEKQPGAWDTLLHAQWHKATFLNKSFKSQANLAPYTYKMLPSKAFQHSILKKLSQNPNISFQQENVRSVLPQNTHTQVVTDQSTYQAPLVFSSLLNPETLKNQQKYPYLKQHFLGWFIKTQDPAFDPEAPLFMDFTVPQQGNTRFMYVLPFSKTEALVEYTLFSEKLLQKSDYENAIKHYLKQKNIHAYQITATEQGNIPMCAYPFHKNNTNTLIHIGTAGGWTKASTGYTFYNTQKQSKKIAQLLKTNKNPKKHISKNRFWWYDLIFLEVLHHNNASGAAIFTQMFQKNSWQNIFLFLNNETTLRQEFAIINSLPKAPFLKALFRAIYKIMFK